MRTLLFRSILFFGIFAAMFCARTHNAYHHNRVLEHVQCASYDVLFCRIYFSYLAFCPTSTTVKSRKWRYTKGEKKTLIQLNRTYIYCVVQREWHLPLTLIFACHMHERGDLCKSFEQRAKEKSH